MAKYRAEEQGQGLSTEFKERGLQAAFTINLQIFKAKFGASRYRYWHFDLNCGTGFNQEISCIGSPLAFLNAAESVGIRRYFAGFCDINKTSLGALQSLPEISGNKDCYLFEGDNRSIISAIPNLIRAGGENPSHAIGMVLSDPNGTQVPIEQMSWLSKQCPKLDFVINWNSTAFKRAHGAGYAITQLPEAIEKLNKRHWLIRNPLSASRFTLLIGRNTEVDEHASLGFFHLNSWKGQTLFDKLGFIGGRNPNRVNPQLSLF